MSGVHFPSLPRIPRSYLLWPSHTEPSMHHPPSKHPVANNSPGVAPTSPHPLLPDTTRGEQPTQNIKSTDRPKFPLFTVMVPVTVGSSRPFYLVHGHFTVLNIPPMYSVTHEPARSVDCGFVIFVLTDSSLTLYYHYSRCSYIGRSDLVTSGQLNSFGCEEPRRIYSH
ncbi:hypothetical protein BDR07DRAFT_17660 [Suillus spraguei]|nr:hypothetical protein BDR07DRAFT_17660 [Suillus spraguei]